MIINLNIIPGSRLRGETINPFVPAPKEVKVNRYLSHRSSKAHLNCYNVGRMQFAVAVTRLARVIAALVPALLSLVLPLQSFRTGSSIRLLHSPERSNGERTPIRNVSCKVQLLRNSYKTFALNVFFRLSGFSAKFNPRGYISRGVANLVAIRMQA